MFYKGYMISKKYLYLVYDIDVIFYFFLKCIWLKCWFLVYWKGGYILMNLVFKRDIIVFIFSILFIYFIYMNFLY